MFEICFLLVLMITSTLADCGEDGKVRLVEEIRSYQVQPNCTVKCSLYCELDKFGFEHELPHPSQTTRTVSSSCPSFARNGSLATTLTVTATVTATVTVTSTVTPTPSPIPIFRDCYDVLNNCNPKSGVYTIQPDSRPPFDVYCDMDTDGGGWTVFQRRQDGSEDFYRNWVNYTNGFGNLSNEFWLGLEFIHRLTNGSKCSLHIDLEDWSGNKRYAQYGSFQVRDASTMYRLEVSGYTGDATDSLTIHSGRPFITYDHDNDDSDSANCASLHKGAWWYYGCHSSNLNGLYHHGSHSSYADGVNWGFWKGYHYSLKFAEMKVRAIG